jgi:anthranilate/para-aminobenzoate synthase component II
VPDLNLGVVVLTNQQSGGAFQSLTYRILDHFMNAPATDWIAAFKKSEEMGAARAAEVEKRQAAARAADSKPSLALAKYAGRYTDAWYGNATISLEQEKLVLRFSHTPVLVADLEHWQYDTFVARWRDRSLEADAFVTFALKPDGIFLSNGPGDPAATGVYAVPEIKKLVASGLPVFGICLGHQMLGLALGGTTRKMHQGHHGANHPVKDFTTGKVEITSMNHGFAVDRDSLPATLEETHVSLFDGSNAGLKLKDRPVFSVQYHPEASPGPQDSHYLFTGFVALMEKRKGEEAA